jgi:hypothetical protein
MILTRFQSWMESTIHQIGSRRERGTTSCSSRRRSPCGRAPRLNNGVVRHRRRSVFQGLRAVASLGAGGNFDEPCRGGAMLQLHRGSGAALTNRSFVQSTSRCGRRGLASRRLRPTATSVHPSPVVGGRAECRPAVPQTTWAIFTVSHNKQFQPTSLALRASAAAELRRWAS